MSLRMGSNQGSTRIKVLDKKVPRNPRYADVQSKASHNKYHSTIILLYYYKHSTTVESTLLLLIYRARKQFPPI